MYFNIIFISISVLDDENFQKSCILGALQSEKAMLQDNVKNEREKVNVQALKAGKTAK